MYNYRLHVPLAPGARFTTLTLEVPRPRSDYPWMALFGAWAGWWWEVLAGQAFPLGDELGVARDRGRQFLRRPGHLHWRIVTVFRKQT